MATLEIILDEIYTLALSLYDFLYPSKDIVTNDILINNNNTTFNNFKKNQIDRLKRIINTWQNELRTIIDNNVCCDFVLKNYTFKIYLMNDAPIQNIIYYNNKYFIYTNTDILINCIKIINEKANSIIINCENDTKLLVEKT